MNKSTISKKDLDRIKELKSAQLKKYIIDQNIKNAYFKFKSHYFLIDSGKITRRFLVKNTVCMACGHIEKMATYAMAQNAMGNKINFTCDCGHITPLPQVQWLPCDYNI